MDIKQMETSTNMSRALLTELEMAHVIIRHAIKLMTTEQKVELGRLNDRAGVAGEGITRAIERAEIIDRAGGTVK